MVAWYWSADTLSWKLSINHNMDVQYQRCTYGNGATLLILFLVNGRTYVRTVMWQPNILGSMGYQNFQRIGLRVAPWTRRSSAKLKKSMKYIEANLKILTTCGFEWSFHMFHGNLKLNNDQKRNYTQGYCSGESNVKIFLKCHALTVYGDFGDVSSFSTENYHWKKNFISSWIGFVQTISHSETDVYSMSSSLQMQIINRPF